MTPVWWMVGGSVASWLVVAALPGVAGKVEVLLGMLGPLAATVGTWVLVARTHRSNPELLTPRMIRAFGVKMVFFGAYVTVMLTMVSLRPIPFVISFTTYFIALYLVVALFLQRLFSGAGTR